MNFIYIFVSILFVTQPSEAITQRKIYTLFTDRKTWNEASAICESQFGQLVKIKNQKEISELQHLVNEDWGNRISTTTDVWSGLHQPFINSTWEYQDCEVISGDVNFTTTFPGGKCATFNGSYSLVEADCSTETVFICQRNEGDCWFEPFTGETYTAPVYNIDTLSLGLEASDCALECRSRTAGSNIECWGFIYDPNGVQGCQLLYLDEASASSTFLTTPKVSSTNQDAVFYIRRCFEGQLDEKTYNSFQNVDQEPETACTTTLYAGEDATANICFCSTQDRPPIPAPVSSEEKAQQYVQELTIDSTNTSAAQNRLNCAEDNRPSAVGVGFVGVGLLTAVFGGLFLMDLSVIISGIKELFCSLVEAQGSAYDAQSSGSDAQGFEYPRDSEC